MSEFRPVSGFQDVWRQLRSPMRITPSLLKSGSFRATMHRIANYAASPVVTKAGAPKSLGALVRNLDYISRKGEHPLEGRDGERLEGMDEIVERAEDWKRDQYDWNRGLTLAHSFVAAMPPGTPYEPVFEAASDFARQAFADTDYLIARHTDEPHPHVHLSIRAQKDDGKQLIFRPLDFQPLRETFAQALRDRGIEAEAAPRAVRGIATKHLRRPTLLMNRDHLNGVSPEPRYVGDHIKDAFKRARDPLDEPKPWEKQIKSVNHQVRENYLRIADGFDQLEDVQSKALARDLRRFVSEMAPPLTRAEQRVEVARDLDRLRVLKRERDLSGPRDRGLERSR